MVTRELMELAAGCVDTSRQAEMHGHLVECGICRATFAECEAVWRAMGAWHVESPAGEADDLTRRVTEAAARERMERTGGAYGRGWRIGPMLRIAAMVVVSASAGMLAGVWSISGAGAVPGVSGRLVAERTLLLAEFQNGSPAKFAQAIAGFDPACVRRDADAAKKQTEKQTEKSP
ncbi:MAG: hypothetical protein WC058_12010 [Phycisphaeraceae bacterium]